MGVNFSTLLYAPVFDMFAVPITVNPVASQPGAPAYGARGIFDTTDIDLVGIDNSIMSDQRTELYLREAEFGVLPIQKDLITIPLDCNNAPLGDYEVIDADTNGGGETKLTIRKIVAAKP